MFESELAALQALYDAILNLPETIASAIVACVYLLLYPIVLLLNLVYGWIVQIFGPLIELVGLFYDVVSSILVDVLGMFDGSFPSLWIFLLGSILTANLVIRVYYLLKGVSIFGWSL